MNDFDLGKILKELEALHQKVDAVSAKLDELVGRKRDKNEAKKAQAKVLNLTPEAVAGYEAQFLRMYERWLANEEALVREELEQMDADELRRLADANNLNVTAKTSKDKVIRLIGFRFREKKQLLHNLGKSPAQGSPKRSSSEQS